MAKSDLIELEGVVTAHNRNIYTVRVETTGKDGDTVIHEINCHLTGKLRMKYIRVLVDDKFNHRHDYISSPELMIKSNERNY